MLYRILRHAIPERCYRAGRELVNLRPFEHGLELQSKDHKDEQFDWLIAAGGA